MNIVLIHYAAPPVVGGVEAVMGRQARLMADAGHHVCVIGGRGAQTDARVEFVSIPEVDSRNPEVLELKAELDAGRVPVKFEPLALRLASRLAEETEGADWIIAHNVCSLNKNLALTAALHRISRERAHPRLVLWHHDLAWTTHRYRSELHEGYPWDLLRRDWPWAEQVVVSGQRQEELCSLLDVPPSRVNVIPNGIEVGEFLKLEAETQGLMQRFQLRLAAPLMLLPVRITPRKNIELALQVLAALHLDLPGARLLVTGPLGPHNPANTEYFERLRTLRKRLELDEQAIFLAEAVDHAIPDAVIADLYKLADLLFLPSREEGFGIPIIEAGLAGLPVFCSDIPALRELGRSDVHFFAPDADPTRLAGQIAAALAKNTSYGLRKRVLADFTWQGIYENRIMPLLEKD